MKKILPILISVLLLSCSKIEVSPTYKTDALGNFDAVWNEFNNLYALFSVKNINWYQLKDQYRSQLNSSSTPHQLYSTLCQMLGNLNDNHVHLLAANEAKFIAGTLNKKPAFPDAQYSDLDEDVKLFRKNIRQNYMLTATEFEIAEAKAFYGTLKITKANKKAGYIYIGNWHISDSKAFTKAINKAVESFRDVDGIIIDERFNYGGYMENAIDLAGRFVDHPIPFATSSTKNGAGANDFSTADTWTIKPSAVNLVGKPVIVVTNGHSLSASDIFAMAMKKVPNAKQVGETTAGAFSMSLTREMPNGWAYAISASMTKSIDGISYEGIGITPDLFATTTKAGILQQKDAQLDKAISQLTKNW